MGTAEDGTDRGIGYGVGLGLIAGGGAVAMFLNPGTSVAGWGFAVAMIAGALAVMAVQLYD